MRLKTHPHFTDKELSEIMNSQKSVRAFKDWQIIYSVQQNYGKKADDFAQILGITKSKIYHVIQLYNKHGESWRNHKNWGGRREGRCVMTFEEEALILKEVEGEALKGKILIYKHIKEAVELKAGREVSDDYIWDLFKRHNWKKKIPRQSHPKGDIEKQEEFKKNSKKTWSPNQ